MSTDQDIVRFNALRNALYHTARRRGLERQNRICNLLVVLLGAAAVGDLATRFGVDQIWIGAAIAFLGALQLVLDFGRQARDHQVLQGQYFDLLSRIDKTLAPNAEQIAAWSGEMISITGNEPPTLRALDAKAYNDALDATEIFEESERLVIPVWHRPLGHLLAFEGHRYRKVGERNTS